MIPVLEVPFHANEDVDVGSFAQVVAKTIDAGADAIMFPAFASEYLKLTEPERRELEHLALTIAAPRRFPVIIAVQHHATKLAVRATEVAVEAGAAAINLLPPHRTSVASAAMRRHLSSVLQAAEDRPVILQYAPAETGATLDLRTILDLASTHPNLWGLKVDSNPAGPIIDALAQSTSVIGRTLGATVGYAGLHLIECFDRGASAVQPGCSFTEIYVKLWQLLTSGDARAAELHRDLLPYLNHWMQSVELIVAAEKEISCRRGWISTATVRQPGVALDTREQNRITRFMDQFNHLLQSTRNDSR